MFSYDYVFEYCISTTGKYRNDVIEKKEEDERGRHAATEGKLHKKSQ